MRQPFDPDAILAAIARGERSCGDLEMHVSGGRRGTRVRGGGGDADACVRAAPLALLGLASGRLDPDAAIASRGIEVSGDAAALRDFSALFDLDSLLARPSQE